MKAAGLLLVLSSVLAGPPCAAQRRAGWDHRNEARRCSNLTLVLDNWKYAIMRQVRDLLLHDHGSMLPEYGRIQPLSAALGDLYQEFSSLKERVAAFTDRFRGVEAFVDDVQSGRTSVPPRLRALLPGETAVGGRPPRRRVKVIVRRVKKPVGSRD